MGCGVGSCSGQGKTTGSSRAIQTLTVTAAGRRTGQCLDTSGGWKSRQQSLLGPHHRLTLAASLQAYPLAPPQRPQLLVYRSGKHIYAQLVDSGTGRTLTGASTRTPAVREGLESTKDVDAAKKVGAEIAKAALSRDIREVTFNRNGFVYGGRIKALADGAREAGLSF